MKTENSFRFLFYGCAVLGLVLGYLSTAYSAPLVTFEMEVAFAIGWIFLTAAFLIDARTIRSEFAPKAWIVMILPLSLALASCIDYFLGRNEYPGTLILYLIYLALLAAAIWLGMQLGSQSQADSSKRFFIIFAAAVFFAAALNGLAGFVQLLRLDVPAWLIASVPSTSRVYGNLRQPNLYSTLLTLGVVALMGLSFLCKRNGSLKWLFLAAAIFLGTASALSASRTGFVIVVAIGVSAWAGSGLPRLSRHIASLAAIANIAAWAALAKLNAAGDIVYTGVQRLDMSGAANFSSRRDDLWFAMLQLIRENPIFGSGFNRLNYDYFMLEVPHRIALNLQNAHNIPLQVAVEHGLPFAFAWLAVLVYMFWTARNTWKIPSARLCWLALIALGIHSCLEYPLWYLYFLLPAGLFMGVLVGCTQNSSLSMAEKDLGERSGVPVRQSIVGFATVAALFATYGIYADYRKILPVFRSSSSEVVMSNLEYGYTTRLFTPWMDYAVVANTPVTPENAKLHNRISKRLSTFSIQSFVVMSQALSNAMLGRYAESAFFLNRLKEMYGDNLGIVLKELSPDEMKLLQPAIPLMKDQKDRKP